MTLRLVVISDFHAGSRFAPAPADWKLNDGTEAGINTGQAWLYQKFLDYSKEFGKPDLLIVNGDAVDGTQHLNYAREVWTSDGYEQIRLAEHLIKLWKAKQIYVTYGCVTPETRIITSDLRWVPASELDVGSKLLAFDAEPKIVGKRRRWRESEVLSAEDDVDEVVEVNLSDGTTITVTKNHPFMTFHGNAFTWTQAGKLKTNRSRIIRLLPVWKDDVRYEEGWLSGFFDGEGTLGQPKRDITSWGRGGYGLSITAAQNEGAALDRACEFLDKTGFRYGLYTQGSRHPNLKALSIRGGMAEQLRFLGRVRPIRLLKKLDLTKLGMAHALAMPKVLGVKARGRQRIVRLGTTTQTYISGGLASHNSRYHVEFQGILIEKFLAKRVHAKRAGWHLNLELAGRRCNFAHEIPVSTTTWQYRTTALGRELVLDRLQNEDKSANLLVRSHAHYFCFVGFSQQLAIVTPGFQGQTPYMVRKNPTQKPKIGVVSIDLPSLDFDYRTADGPLLRAEAL